MKPVSGEAIFRDSQIRQKLAKLFRTARTNKRLSVREVVNTCKTLGWQTSPTQYNRIEKAQADITISQSLVLAKVLGIFRHDIAECIL